MIYVGIDPGKTGGIVELHARGEARRVFHEMPYIGDEIDVRRIATFLKDAQRVDEVCVALEKQQSMPKQGVKGVFTLGDCYGSLRSTVIVLGFSLELVRPQEWKKEFGIPAGSDKKASVAAALRIFPDAVTALTGPRGAKKDGLAEALLMAEWLRRKRAG